MSSRRRATLSPSLFPFLAVLVCTLGTLILLLALVSQNAATAATQHAEAQEALAEKAAADAIVKAKRDANRMTGSSAASMIAEEAFRVEQLVSFRDQQTADLGSRRDQLGQVEAHMQRLKDELKQLSDEADIATGETAANAVDPNQLQRLRKQVDAESELLEELVANGSSKTPLVALIPHKGPNGTDRRPVYLECTAKGLTIWPEGSQLTAGQLEESVSGANPLDEALRVVRNHVLQNYGDDAPPYPMLVVRPDGIDTYAAARIALQDWDDQFGYELVPDKVQLAYGTPDESLKRRVDEAIRAAVINQHGMRALAQRAKRGYQQSGAIEQNKRYPRLSAAAMDQRGRSSGYSNHREGRSRQSIYSGQQGSGFSGSQYGGGTGADAAEQLDRRLREAASEMNAGQMQAGPVSNGQLLPGTMGQPGTTGQSDTRSTNSFAGDSDSPGESTAADKRSAAKTLNPEAGTALAALGDSMPLAKSQDRVRPNQFVNPDAVPDGMLQREANPFTMPGTAGQADSPRSDWAHLDRSASAADPGSQAGGQASSQANSRDGSVTAQRSPSGSPSGSQSRNTSPPNSQPPNSPSPSDPNAGSSSQSMEINQPQNQSHDQLARQAELQQRAAEEAAARSPVDAESSSVNQSASRELVDRGGDQWALPRSVAASRGNSIVRTIRVQCYPNRLVLVASARGGATEMFGLADDDMNRATLELASAVRDRIQQWGAALPGGRWQPRLDVEVMSGGDERYYELQRMMSGSGVNVVGRRSETTSTGASR